jgi:hypothetical protein
MRLPTPDFVDGVLSALHTQGLLLDDVQRVQWTDQGRTWTLAKTVYPDGFVEVLAKSVHATSVRKAWVYKRSQNPTLQGAQRGDWVVQVYA